MPETDRAKTKKPVETILGFDFGEQRIGIAVGQMITRTASPLETLNNIQHKPDWDKIGKLIQQWHPQVLVIGIPYLLDGSETEMSQRAVKFGKRLHGRFGLPVQQVSEVLSSYEAEEQLRQHKKINKHNKHEVDKMAAALIIETWLQQQPL